METVVDHTRIEELDLVRGVELAQPEEIEDVNGLNRVARAIADTERPVDGLDDVLRTCCHPRIGWLAGRRALSRNASPGKAVAWVMPDRR